MYMYRRALFDMLNKLAHTGGKFIHLRGMHVQTLPIRVLCAL